MVHTKKKVNLKIIFQSICNNCMWCLWWLFLIKQIFSLEAEPNENKVYLILLSLAISLHGLLEFYLKTSQRLEAEKAMAPHSSTLAWKIPWTEEPGRLQFMGSLRVGHDWATSLSLFTFMHWRRNWQPTPVFLPGESQGRGSLVGCLSLGSHRVGHDWSDLAAAAAAETGRPQVNNPCSMTL